MRINFSNLTTTFQHKAHKRLWNWLAKNPRKQKKDWPGWHSIPYALVRDCFACEYAWIAREELEEGLDLCYYCPLCAKYSDMCLAGLFNTWAQAKYPSRRMRKIRIAAARKIANLKVKEGVKCL